MVKSPPVARHWACEQLPALPESASVARRLAREFFSGLADEGVLAEIVLTTSELVTNAVKHGQARRIWLHFAVTADRVAVTVSNGGLEACAGDMLKGSPSHSSEGGRGLDIVRALNDEVAIFRGGVTIVRAASQRCRAPRPSSPRRLTA